MILSTQRGLHLLKYDIEKIKFYLIYDHSTIVLQDMDGPCCRNGHMTFTAKRYSLGNIEKLYLDKDYHEPERAIAQSFRDHGARVFAFYMYDVVTNEIRAHAGELVIS